MMAIPCSIIGNLSLRQTRRGELPGNLDPRDSIKNFDRVGSNACQPGGLVAGKAALEGDSTRRHTGGPLQPELTSQAISEPRY